MYISFYNLYSTILFLTKNVHAHFFCERFRYKKNTHTKPLYF